MQERVTTSDFYATMIKACTRDDFPCVGIFISLKVSCVWGPGLVAQSRKEVAEGAGTCLVMRPHESGRSHASTGAEMNGGWRHQEAFEVDNTLFVQSLL